jgi:Fe-S-cluster containining protein
MTQNIPLRDEKKTLLKLVIEGYFSCQRCGACCRTDGWVYVTDQEAYNIAQFLEYDPFTFFQDLTIRDRGWRLLATPHFQRSCFLDATGHCAIYPVRPRGCRSYPYELNGINELDHALALCPELQRLHTELTTRELSAVTPKITKGKL